MDTLVSAIDIFGWFNTILAGDSSRRRPLEAPTSGIEFRLLQWTYSQRMTLRCLNLLQKSAMPEEGLEPPTRGL